MIGRVSGHVRVRRSTCVFVCVFHVFLSHVRAQLGGHVWLIRDTCCSRSWEPFLVLALNT